MAEFLVKHHGTCTIERWSSKPDEVQVCSLLMCNSRLPASGRALGGFASCGVGGMLVKYSESEGVEVGITKTFDGKHPCDLCLSIAKNKQTEKKQSSQLAAAKIFNRPHSALEAAASPLLLAFKDHRIASLVGCDSRSPGSSSSGVLRANQSHFQSCFHGTLGDPSHPNRKSRSHTADFSHPKVI